MTKGACCFFCKKFQITNIKTLSGFCRIGWPANKTDCPDYEDSQGTKTEIGVNIMTEEEKAYKVYDACFISHNCGNCPLYKGGCSAENRNAVVGGLLKKVAEQAGKDRKQSVLKDVGDAIAMYKVEFDHEPTMIIANTAAYEAIEREAAVYGARKIPNGCATFRGIPVYKADDGRKRAIIRLCRDVKTYDVEQGEK